MVNIVERIRILFPGIIIGPAFDKNTECEISNGKITYWNRPEPQPSDPELEAVPDADAEGYLADEWLRVLLLRLKAEADRRVDLIIAAREVVHWIGVSNAISRKHDLWLAEKITADEEQRPADEETYPTITDDEHQIWFSLSLIQDRTSTVRGASMAIAATWHLMTSAEKLAVTDDDIASHILWP